MSEAKKVPYRVRNWREYNEALIGRGSLTLWFAEETVQSWLNTQRSGKGGHPYEYSVVAVGCMLLLKQVFHLGLRQTQGFMQSIFQLVGQGVPVMSYSQLSRRQKDLVVDATGLKVYGEGEWKTRQHNISKRRTWAKVHLAFDADTHEVVAEIITPDNVHEKEELPDLLAQIGEEIAQVSVDTGYDYQTC